jgi:hypothetical protein
MPDSPEVADARTHFPVLSTLVMVLRSAAVTPKPYFALMLIWVSTYQVRFARLPRRGLQRIELDVETGLTGVRAVGFAACRRTSREVGQRRTK